MTKIKETGAAPVSKYAAKNRSRIVATETKAEPILEQNNAPAITDSSNTAGKPVIKKRNGLPPVTANFPEHIVQIALLIKNNAEIRRFTALGILNYLLQKKEIEGDKRYVSFKWNKFAVKANGLMREYSYNEPFFLNALVASFSSFSASAQRTIDAFCRKEMSVGITKAVDSEEVNNIAEMNEQYQGTGNEGDEE